LNLLEIFFPGLNSVNNKQNINYFNKAKEIIRNRMSINNVIQKIIEVDQLKGVILNELQLSVFNTLPKPRILKERLNDKNNKIIKTESLVKMINTLQCSEGNPEINHRIINMFEYAL
jgi:hypothetical protein